MTKSDLIPRHIVKKSGEIKNFELYHILFLTITLLGILAFTLNLSVNIRNNLFILTGTLPELLFTLLGLLLFIRFKPKESVMCYFYDDKLELTWGELDHSENELFYEHIKHISYERHIKETHTGEKCFDYITFLYEEKEIHLSPYDWPDDLHRLLHYYAEENNIPLNIDQDMEQQYKINA